MEDGGGKLSLSEMTSDRIVCFVLKKKKKSNGKKCAIWDKYDLFPLEDNIHCVFGMLGRVAFSHTAPLVKSSKEVFDLLQL